MIKYLELTAPNESAFRQAKIMSIECSEGGQVRIGSTLFTVKSGKKTIDLPSTMDGKVVELIASVGENITLSTALLLLETEVASSTASKPTTDNKKTTATANGAATVVAQKGQTEVKKEVSKTKKKVSSKKRSEKAAIKEHKQQMLDLSGNKVPEAKNEVVTNTTVPGNAEQSTHSSSNTTGTNATSETMSANSTIQITVPDIGADSAKVIEILVSVGDTVAAEDPLITLESDKASMDVPSPNDGVISAITVLLDQDVSEGTLIVELIPSETPVIEESAPATAPQTPQTKPKDNTESIQTTPDIVEVRIPDIGGDSAKVIEILVDAGQQVSIEDPLVTLESDKASMDVPSSVAGIIKTIEVAVDQDVSEGDVVLTVQAGTASSTTMTSSAATSASSTPAPVTAEKHQAEVVKTNEKALEPAAPPASVNTNAKSHASPSIRRVARELGVDLGKVSGSGRKGRITKDDVNAFVKGIINRDMSTPSATTSGSGIPPIPAQDFSKFGEIDIQPLNKIKRLTATNLHRSWVNVPHVTHNDESNISDLESFRKQLNAEYVKQKKDIKLSPLAFVVKALVNAMQIYPQFNSSLEAGGENLIYKKYFNVGIAVDTPNGLVVPVIKDADQKSVAEIAIEMGELAAKARDKKLTMADMSGACITISSLGGIGGTHFTPIVNAPEVAILGVSRGKMQPVWNGNDFEPGLILPLSLSYDHRVIDGAEAARFTRRIAAVLEDVRRLVV